MDGYSHLLEEVQEKDIIRQQKLEEAGFTVLRFKDADILRNIKNTRMVISNMITLLKESK